MNKELQDLVWSILPKEFREEVRELYDGCIKMMDIRPSASEIYANKLTTLEYLFGLHNLTSDAEGEEMLTVSRTRVQRRYHMAYECKHSGLLSHDDVQFWKGWQGALDDLFGSKCLPDNVATSAPNVDSSVGSVESLKPKPAGPKFKVGDKVRYRCDGKIHEVKAKTGKYHYALSGLGHDAHEEYLELYTEPKENIAETRNFSQDCDKQFDNILKDSIAKERRLAIAAQMMQGLICAPLVPGVDPNPPAENLAQTAFRLADALIAESEKGGAK